MGKQSQLFADHLSPSEETETRIDVGQSPHIFMFHVLEVPQLSVAPLSMNIRLKGACQFLQCHTNLVLSVQGRTLCEMCACCVCVCVRVHVCGCVCGCICVRVQ